MSSQSPKFKFAVKLKELEAITDWFESEDIDLDEALPKFERGLGLISELKAHLQSVENEVAKIKRRFDQVATEPETEPDPEQ